MSKNYHNQMIDSFLENPFLFSDDLGFIIKDVKKEFSMGNGDIDILVEGTMGEKAIIEVKSHSGLLPHFVKKQLPKYINYFPEAKVFALVGYQRSLNLLDFKLKKYK